jgi:prepilin-type N-terminal cleavage/methylation domain-containing protein
MKRAFSLLEILWVILLIGILSAFALPKFKALTLHTDVSVLVSAYTHVKQNATQVYQNLTALEDVQPEDIRMDTLLSVTPLVPYDKNQAYTRTWTLKNKRKSKSVLRYYIDPGNYIRFRYLLNGVIELRISLYGPKKEEYKRSIEKQLGIVFYYNSKKEKWLYDEVIDMTN